MKSEGVPLKRWGIVEQNNSRIREDAQRMCIRNLQSTYAQRMPGIPAGRQAGFSDKSEQKFCGRII